jgi:hypothetical protein
MSRRALSSASSADRSQTDFTVTQSVAYSHQNPVLGGFHSAGSRSPLERLVEALTARRASEWVRSFAYGPCLDANGLRDNFGGRSVVPRGDEQGQRDVGPAEPGPGLLHGFRCGLRRIGVGRERRADPHLFDPNTGGLRP